MPLSTKRKLKLNLFLLCVALRTPLNIYSSTISILSFSYFSPPSFVHYLSSSQTTKAFLPRMVELQHGHVVCINSILSQSPIPGAIDYCTSKASSLAFMESLTLGLLDCPGVGCTTVLPFHTNTEMFQGMRVRYFLSWLDHGAFWKWIFWIFMGYSLCSINSSIVSYESLLRFGFEEEYGSHVKAPRSLKCSSSHKEWNLRSCGLHSPLQITNDNTPLLWVGRSCCGRLVYFQGP